MSFISCSSDDGESENNPFVGVWKEQPWGHILKFYSNGEFDFTIYFTDDWIEHRSGTYSYDNKNKTLLYMYDQSGLSSELFYVEYISKDKIVYIDPDDLATTTLVRTQ